MTSIVSEDIYLLGKRASHTSGALGYTSGVFDLFHQGHLNYLRACKCAVDLLVVGVDDDILVQRNKGDHRPYEQSVVRVTNVQKTGIVDGLFIKSVSSEILIPFIRPNKYFVPSNRQISSTRVRLLEELAIELIVIPYTHGVSTTAIARERGLVPPVQHSHNE